VAADGRHDRDYELAADEERQRDDVQERISAQTSTPSARFHGLIRRAVAVGARSRNGLHEGPEHVEREREDDRRALFRADLDQGLEVAAKDPTQPAA